MKIGFDAKRAFNNSSGLGNYSRFVINTLDRFCSGNSYYLYTPADSGKFQFDFGENVIKRLPHGFIDKTFKSLWRSHEIINDLKKDNIDIYHGLSNEIPFGIQKTGIKSVVTIHDLIFLRFPEYYDFISRNIYNKKFRYSCEKADSIVAVSEQTKRDIIEIYGINEEKIKVIYQSCSPIFYNKIDEETKAGIKKLYDLPDSYILSVGTIEKRKNLLNTVKAVVEGKAEFSLVAIGRPTPYLNEIKKYIDEKNATNRVLFRHNIPTVHLPAIYQSAALFIYISEFEGFGIPVLEALASGVPVITSGEGCFKEVGGNASFYVNVHDVSEIAGSIDKILVNNDIKNKMIIAGLEQAGLFNDKKIAWELMEVYKGLVG